MCFIFSFRNCDKPRLIEALKTKRIRDIACGSSHSAAITSSGELYSWGLGEYGRLGHGDNTTQLRPKLVSSAFVYFTHMASHCVISWSKKDEICIQYSLWWIHTLYTVEFTALKQQTDWLLHTDLTAWRVIWSSYSSVCRPGESTSGTPCYPSGLWEQGCSNSSPHWWRYFSYCP